MDNEQTPGIPPVPNDVRSARKDARLTIAQLAARAGVTPGYLSRLERGEVGARMPTRIVLSAALGRPLRALFPETDPSGVQITQGPDGFLLDHSETRVTFASTYAEEVADVRDGALVASQTGGRVHEEVSR